MKIVYATDNYWPRFSGMAVSIDTFKNELERMGHEVFVFAPDYGHSKNKTVRPDAGGVFRFNSHKLHFSKEDRLVKYGGRKKAAELLAQIDPDILHIQTEFFMGKIVRDWAIKNNKPLVMTCHTYWEHYVNHYMPVLPAGTARLFVRKYIKNFYKKADARITPTELMRDILGGYGLAGDIAVIPTGIADKDFSGASKCKEKTSSKLFTDHPQLKNKKIMLFVGRIGHEKNIMLLLTVLKSVLKQVPSAHLLLVGDGPQKEEMLAHAKKDGISDHITFAGYVARQELKYYYALADVFTFPSKTETQGLVTIESMTCGTPVVAVGEMGTKSVMKGDNGGFMVADDAAQFAEKVILLMRDENLYGSKAKEALAYSKNFTIQSCAEKLLRVYDETLRYRPY